METWKGSLEAQLQVWHDWDATAFWLAVSLGLLAMPTADRSSYWETGGSDTKWIFWSANPVGEGLNRMLRELVAMGVLEEREGYQEFRCKRGNLALADLAKS